MYQPPNPQQPQNPQYPQYPQQPSNRSFPPGPPPNTQYPGQPMPPPPYQGQPMQPGMPPPYPGQMPPPKRKMPVWQKVLIGVAVGFVALCALVNGVNRAGQPSTQPTATQAAQPTEKPTQAQTAPTPTPKPVSAMNIIVTSMGIKEVEGKYRYFFDVRNKDTKPFEGSATIEVFNDLQQTRLGGETFDTTKPMEPGLGALVFFESFQGPPVVHAEFGITHFKYVITVDGSEVNSGEGKIEDKLTS